MEVHRPGMNDLLFIYINNLIFFILLAFLYRKKIYLPLTIILINNSMLSSYISLSHFWRSGRSGDLLIIPLSLLEGSSALLGRYRRWLLIGLIYLAALLPLEYLVYLTN